MVGLELDPKVLKSQAHRAAAISIAGIALPFAVGVAVSYGLYNAYADTSKPFSSFVVFMGTAISITAFPVLARILTELKLLGTEVGLTTIAAGLGNDAGKLFF